MMTSNHPSVAERLKDIMSELPVPLTIITAEFDGVKRAVTISSFTCHSMRPPLITFNIDCGSQFCEVIKNTSHFAVHFPNENHIHICKHLAQKGLTSEEQFSIIQYEKNEFQTPIITDIPSILFCQKEEIIKVGDHIILVGRVIEAKKTDEKTGLLYHQRSFITI
ncbi:MAG: flavin reductase family protein [Chitinophagales bacterium]|nr:flavin reductase family protein [Chitinophagales bacterium]